MKKLILLSTIFFYIFSITAHAKLSTEDPAPKKQEHIEFSIDSGHHINENGKNWLVGAINIKMAPNWHIYWNKVDNLGLASKISMINSRNLADHQILWPTPKRKTTVFTSNFGLEDFESFIYEDYIQIPFKVLPLNEKEEVKLTIDFQYALCNDFCISNEVKLPITMDLARNDREFAYHIQKEIDQLPKPIEETGIIIQNAKLFKSDSENGVFMLRIKNPNKKTFEADMAININGTNIFTKPQIYYAENGIIKLISKFQLSQYGLELNDGSKINVKGNFFYNGYKKMVEFERDLIISDASNINQSKNKSKSLVYVILIAILGGLILNFMPCVLPVLSIKVLSVMNNSLLKKSQIRISFLITALGIVVSFMILAFATMALKASGKEFNYGFQFQEPIFIITMTLIMLFFISNLLGQFELSFSSKTLTKINKFTNRSDWGYVPRSFFSGFLATILATPCSAPFVGPSITFALSQSYFEIAAIFTSMGIGMSLPFLAFAIVPNSINLLPKPGNWMHGLKKFLAVLLILTMLWLIFILSNQLGRTAAFILFSILVLLKFTIARKRSMTKKISILILIAACYLLPNFYYNLSLKDQIQIVKAWHKFEESKIHKIVESGRVVVVDITSDWCINCKINKFTVLDREFITQHLLSSDIYPMRADITKPDPKINEFMKKNGRYGIPFNIIYGPNAPRGILLPELLTPSIFLKSLKKAKGGN